MINVQRLGDAHNDIILDVSRIYLSNVSSSLLPISQHGSFSLSIILHTGISMHRVVSRLSHKKDSMVISTWFSGSGHGPSR